MAWRLFAHPHPTHPRTARPRILLQAECLESRVTPAAMTAYEVHALQIVNQLRADPAAFANDLKQLYLGGSYRSPSGYAASDPIWTDLRGRINAAQAQTSWRSGFTSTGADTFLSVASALAPKAPLVWDAVMQDGAVGHNQWMYANVFAHSVSSPGLPPSSGETPANHIPGIPRNYSVAQGDYYDYIGLGLNAAGENVGWGVNQGPAALQAYKNGQISLDGFYQRMVYADVLAFVMECGNGGANPWGHLENLTSATFDFNIFGLATYLYENPVESPQDGIGQSYFSTHRIGLRPNVSAANVFVYQDLNNNNVYDAGEGVPGLLTFNFGPGALALPATGYSAIALPASGTYAITATYLGKSLGTQQLAANGSNKSIAFNISAVQPTTTTLTATPNASTGGALVTLTATVSPSPGNVGTVSFFDNGALLPGAANVVLVGDTATFQITTLTPGTHSLTASYSGANNLAASTSNTVNQVVVAAAPAPQLVSVTPNANILSLVGAQRSRVVSLVVVFDQAVQLDTNALTLALHTNNVVWNGAVQPTGFGALPSSLALNTSGNVIWVVTFAGNTDNGSDGLNSLKDGVYDFSINAAKVHPMGAPAINMTTSATTVVHRLFGDAKLPGTPSGGSPNTDFQATVSSGDNLTFRSAFNAPANYKTYLDFNGDAAINSGDNLQFRNRFNKTLTWRL